MMRRRIAPALAAFAIPLAWGLAAADEARAVGASLFCQDRGSRGRVVCEVEVEALDASLAWVDAIVVAAPDFALPLKVRVAEDEASSRTERRARLPIGFVATDLGEGTVEVVARAVICRGSETAAVCLPHTKKISGRLSVGPLGAR